MKRVNISIPDDVYELLRKQAFDDKVQPGTLAAQHVVTLTQMRTGGDAALKSLSMTAEEYMAKRVKR